MKTYVFVPTGANITRPTFPIILFKTGYALNALLLVERDLYLGSVWRRGGYGQVCGGRRASELAADCREATPGQGARYPRHNNVMIELALGASHDMSYDAGGHSQTVEQHGWRRRSSISATAGEIRFMGLWL
jgi:hypothetical protein